MGWSLKATASVIFAASLPLVVLLDQLPLLHPAAAEADAQLALNEKTPPPESDECWIFTHLQKCGGSTVKGILSETWGPRYFIYDSMRWKMGGDFLKDFAHRFVEKGQWNVMTGGYPEALRRSTALDGNKCRWFTMFRHPISRLVSAYFYCRDLPGDVACASEVLNARDVDLLGFAKHWGSFGMRQFVLSIVDNDEVMAYARSPAGREKLPQVPDIEKVSGWYLLKMFLDEKGAATGVDIPDVAMYEMLEPVEAMLRNSYAAVGILEKFNTTLSLFDAALEMPGVDWERQFHEEGRINTGRRHKREEAAALEEAWTDPKIRKYVWLDLLLYGQATAIFRDQTRALGLE